MGDPLSCLNVTSAPTCPKVSSDPKPLQSITIDYSQNSNAAQQLHSRRESIAINLLDVTSNSTTSLSSISTSAPATSWVQAAEEQSSKLSVNSGRSLPFSNPFKKLQHTFQSRKVLELGVRGPEKEKVLSSSASAMTLTSWRSKAEMLSKKSWGRSRKNSEPTFSGLTLPQTPIFGASLDDAIRSSHIPGAPMVPAVLFRCAEFLEAKGVHEVGLYRVPGSHASVQKLKKMFDSGKDYDLLAMDSIDPNDIATLLKLYLRELPTPLLPAFVLEQFQSVISTDRQICHILREILVRLPRHNYVVLSFLCHHLSRIAAHSDKTKMNVSNLGVVFAPTLSIGSILFRALLGGYYDTEETVENRAKGLEIVWGGTVQEFALGTQQWPKESHEDRLHPLQTVPSKEDKRETSDFDINNCLDDSSPSSGNSAHLAPSAPSVSDRDEPFSLPETTGSDTKLLTIATEDGDNLLKAVLPKNTADSDSRDDEGMPPNAPSSSPHLSPLNSTGSVLTSDLSAKDEVFEASLTSPPSDVKPSVVSANTSVATVLPASDATSPSHLTLTASMLHPSAITTSVTTTAHTAGTTSTTQNSCSVGHLQAPTPSHIPANPIVEKALPLLPFISFSDDPRTSNNAKAPDAPDCTKNFEHKSASGAPQLPPLEDLLISL
ncbi:hypothetical protein BGZ94_009338 [Podila epigama]|nr:hypothetical protein BGZ94_009338 [Podila epigama]